MAIIIIIIIIIKNNKAVFQVQIAHISHTGKLIAITARVKK